MAGEKKDVKDKVLYSVRNTVMYEDGHFEFGGTQSSVAEYWGIASTQFNQLKAKLFNLIEGAVPDERQQTALKRLIRGFCNDNFRLLADDMQDFLFRMGVTDARAHDFPMSANPLESNVEIER